MGTAAYQKILIGHSVYLFLIDGRAGLTEGGYGQECSVGLFATSIIRRIIDLLPTSLVVLDHLMLLFLSVVTNTIVSRSSEHVCNQRQSPTHLEHISTDKSAINHVLANDYFHMIRSHNHNDPLGVIFGGVHRATPGWVSQKSTEETNKKYLYSPTSFLLSRFGRHAGFCRWLLDLAKIW